MRKVISGSLNGNAYQFEERAFLAVQTYLGNAAARFATNPDRAEILADLEQAVADKCDTFLGKHKTVVTVEEVQQILREMGPLDSGATDSGQTEYSTEFTASAQAPASAPRRRRLFRLTNEGMMGGVCAGVAAYLNVDVVLVRVAYVLLTLCTGAWFVVWLTQLCVTPKAFTPEDIAAAHGDPINAREVINRARRGGRTTAQA